MVVLRLEKLSWLTLFREYKYHSCMCDVLNCTYVRKWLVIKNKTPSFDWIRYEKDKPFVWSHVCIVKLTIFSCLCVCMCMYVCVYVNLTVHTDYLISLKVCVCLYYIIYVYMLFLVKAGWGDWAGPGENKISAKILARRDKLLTKVTFIIHTYIHS